MNDDEEQDGLIFGERPARAGRRRSPSPDEPGPAPAGDGGEDQPTVATSVSRRLPAAALLVVFLAAAVLVERGNSGELPVPAVTLGAEASVIAAAETDDSAVWFCAAGTGWGSTEARPGDATKAGTSTTTSRSGARRSSTTTEPDEERAPTGTAPPGTRGSAGSVPLAPGPVVTPTDIVAEHRLLLTNSAGSARNARVTVYPSDESTEPVQRDVELKAHERRDLDLGEVVRSPFVSALVEVDGGQVAVAHRLRGPTGESMAPCASTTSRSWYFAAGSTDGETRQVLVLFNPFPQQVVVDVTFQAEDVGGRQTFSRPQRLEGLVVPAHRPLAVDITEDIGDRRQLATRVEARDPTARLVADRLVLNPGGPAESPFLSVAPGANAARSAWVFADGRPRRPEDRPDSDTTFLLYNPSGEPVDVELRVRPDRLVAAPEAFKVTVRTGEYQQITLDERVGTDAGYWAALVATSRGTFVAERVVRARAQDPPKPAPGAPPILPAVVDAGGVTFTPGTPVLAREWIVPGASSDDGAGLVAITNLGKETVTLHVEALVEGRAIPLAGYDAVTLESGLRTTVDLAEPSLVGPDGRRALRVRADGPVVVEATLAPASPARGVSDLLAVPVRDGLSTPAVDILELAVPSTQGPEEPEPVPEGEGSGPGDESDEPTGPSTSSGRSSTSSTRGSSTSRRSTSR